MIEKQGFVCRVYNEINSLLYGKSDSDRCSYQNILTNGLNFFKTFNEAKVARTELVFNRTSGNNFIEKLNDCSIQINKLEILIAQNKNDLNVLENNYDSNFVIAYFDNNLASFFGPNITNDSIDYLYNCNYIGFNKLISAGFFKNTFCNSVDLSNILKSSSLGYFNLSSNLNFKDISMNK